MIFANVTKGTLLMTEMTNKGESRFNHGLEWANVLFVTMTDIATSYNLRMHQKRNKKCDKNRDPHLFACVNKLLASETSCEIPWLKQYSPPGLKKCTNEEIMQYFEFAYKIFKIYFPKVNALLSRVSFMTQLNWFCSGDCS